MNKSHKSNTKDKNLTPSIVPRIIETNNFTYIKESESTKVIGKSSSRKSVSSVLNPNSNLLKQTQSSRGKLTFIWENTK